MSKSKSIRYMLTYKENDNDTIFSMHYTFKEMNVTLRKILNDYNSITVQISKIR